MEPLSLLLTLPKLATVGVSMLALHSEPGFNSVVPGLYGVLENGVTVGYALNSHGRPSFYAGMTFAMQHRAVEYAVTVGGITGYKAMKIAPMVVPSIKHKDWPIRVSYLPRPPWQGSSDAVLFSAEWKWKELKELGL